MRFRLELDLMLVLIFPVGKPAFNLSDIIGMS